MKLIDLINELHQFAGDAEVTIDQGLLVIDDDPDGEEVYLLNLGDSGIEYQLKEQ